MQYLQTYNSPLGIIYISCNDEGLTGLWFDGQKYFPDNLKNDYITRKHPLLDETKQWLEIYFHGQNPLFIPKMSIMSSPFRQRVWELLLEIPYGKTTSYLHVANRIAKERNLTHMSPQAIGGAISHNPISIIIPCHRVIGNNGNMTGYAGGIEKKIKLLKLEKFDKINFHHFD